ncbi:MAG: AAA family ATPase [Candidatus Pacebacteria bacterium]|jgi:DNA polymerase III delta prime subunit|nr:AAA family ATPase [Candidatus Paceibacterota bacterium]|tara:strand:- start:737 stop:1678 length:942 start_codon:yes stop_codon:yes gene_type:complete
MTKEYLWVEKYRPTTIDDCILPNGLKSNFSDLLKQGNLPNLLLHGGPGVGKTTVAKALVNQLGSDYIVINGSMEGNIDTLRNKIQNYASAMSLVNDGKKYVILDEADYLNAISTQPALRNFMEEFSKSCGFILTCNYINRIIKPLHGRCSIVNFKIGNQEKPLLASQFLKRIEYILNAEGVQYDQKVIAEMIMKYMPDWRRLINELQRYAACGQIDAGVLVQVSDKTFMDLVTTLKEKEFTNMRKWVGANLDNDFESLCRRLYDTCYDYTKPESVPQLVITLAEYQYKNAFASDTEINTVAMLTEIMMNVEFN